MAQQTEASEEKTATVSESKFNGTATLEMQVPVDTEKRKVERIARDYFKENHGTDPSKVVADKDEMTGMFGDEERWTVMVSDHSSGSFVDTEEYDL